MITERFEMRLDEDLAQRVDEWRAEQDVGSRAEAIRQLIEVGLRHARRGDVIRFSAGEKMIIAMMRDLYKGLEVQGDINPDFVMEAIWGGHSWALKWDLTGLYHEHEDSPTTVSEVGNILDMWSFIEEAYEKLSPSDKEILKKEATPFGENVKFRGFDGNNEAEHMGVAYMFVDKMDRWSRFKGCDLNSHHPTLRTYRLMLQTFKPLRETLIGRGLNVKELIGILRRPND